MAGLTEVMAVAEHKSKSKIQKTPDGAPRRQPLPSDPQTLRRMLADLQAFLDLLETARDRGEFEWFGKAFAYLEPQDVAPGNGPNVPRKPRGLNLTPGLLLALQFVDAKDFVGRVAVMKAPLDAWQAESEKPAGRQILVGSAAVKACFKRTAAMHKARQALTADVLKAVDHAVALFYDLRQRILKRLAKAGLTSKVMTAQTVENAEDKQTWTPPQLAERWHLAGSVLANSRPSM